MKACVRCGLRHWTLNPFGYYCGNCGHQVGPDLEDRAFDVLNYPPDTERDDFVGGAV